MKHNVVLNGEDNEDKIINFLREELNLNNAAICGILGNMYIENSKFDPTQEEIGDGEGYGLCQWTIASRKNTLMTYYDYDTLEGQLAFMYDELKYGHDYDGVLDYLYNVEVSKEGAEAAAKYFCDKYEKPEKYVEDDYYEEEWRGKLNSDLRAHKAGECFWDPIFG